MMLELCFHVAGVPPTNCYGDLTVLSPTITSNNTFTFRKHTLNVNPLARYVLSHIKGFPEIIVGVVIVKSQSERCQGVPQATQASESPTT